MDSDQVLNSDTQKNEQGTIGNTDAVSSFSAPAPNIILPASGQVQNQKMGASETIASIINSTRMKTAPPVIRSFNRDMKHAAERKKNMENAALLRKSMGQDDDKKIHTNKQNNVPAPDKKKVTSDIVQPAVIVPKKEDTSVVPQSVEKKEPENEKKDIPPVVLPKEADPVTVPKSVEKESEKKDIPRMPVAPPPIRREKQTIDTVITKTPEKPVAVEKKDEGKKNTGFLKSLGTVPDIGGVTKKVVEEKKISQSGGSADAVQHQTVTPVTPVASNLQNDVHDQKKQDSVEKPSLPVPIKKTPEPLPTMVQQPVKKDTDVDQLSKPSDQKTNVPKDATAQKAIDDLLVAMGNITQHPPAPEKPIVSELKPVEKQNLDVQVQQDAPKVVLPDVLKEKPLSAPIPVSVPESVSVPALTPVMPPVAPIVQQPELKPSSPIPVVSQSIEEKKPESKPKEVPLIIRPAHIPDLKPKPVLQPQIKETIPNRDLVVLMKPKPFQESKPVTQASSKISSLEVQSPPLVPEQKSKPIKNDDILSDIIFATEEKKAVSESVSKKSVARENLQENIQKQPEVKIKEIPKEAIVLTKEEPPKVTVPIVAPKPRPSYHISAEELNVLGHDISRIEEEIKVLLVQQQSIGGRKQRIITEKADLESKARDIKQRLDTVLQKEKEFVERIFALENQETGITNKDERHRIEELRWKEEDARALVAKERWDLEDTQDRLIKMTKEKQDEFVRVTESENELLRRVEFLTRERNEKRLKVRLGEVEEKKRELEDIQLALLEEKRRLDKLLVTCEEKEKDLLKKRQNNEDEEKHSADPARKRAFEEARRSIEKQQREIEQRRWEAEKTLEKVNDKITKSNEHHETISKIEEEVRQKLA